jgi:hypothetical protein
MRTVRNRKRPLAEVAGFVTQTNKAKSNIA